MSSSIDITYEVDVADPDLFRRLESLPHEVERLLREAVNDIAMATQSDAQALAPFRTGNLKRNIGSDPARADGRTGGIQATVGVRRTAPYGEWVHGGTGIFGRYARPLRPTSGNILTWRFYPTGVFVHARTVKGQRAQPFMEQAFKSVNAGYAPLRLRQLATQVGNL